MSGVAKSVGKVFKKVAKVAKVVLPIALAAAAVIFTGGAALGVLPSFAGAIGGIVTSLGIGGAVAGALTGAVVGAGFGSAVGGLTSAATGKNIMKGMQTGALTGAVTGGITGGLNPSTFGVVRGADGAWTTTHALKGGSILGAADKGATLVKDSATGFYSRVGDAAASGGAGNAAGAAGKLASDVTPMSAAQRVQEASYSTPVGTTSLPASSAPSISMGGQSAAGGGLNLGGALGQTVPSGGFNFASQAAEAVNGLSAAGAGGGGGAAGGLMGFINKNPLIAGNVVKSIGGALSGGGESASDSIRARGDEERRMAEFAYGGVYTRPQPFGQSLYTPPPARWYLDPVTNTVKERAV